MQILKTVVLLTLLVGSIDSIAAQNNSEDQLALIAIQLDSGLAELFQEEARCEAFSVDEKGVLRPQKAYRMTYNLKEELIEIKYAHLEKSIYPFSNNFKEVPLPGGRGKVACYCEEGEDDCDYKKTDEDGPNRDDYECTGSCSCGLAVIIFPGISIPTIQTADGNWHGFDKIPR